MFWKGSARTAVLKEAALGEETMTCPIQNKRDEQILVEYCAGTLEAGGVRQIEGHISECAECTEWIASQSAVWSALDDFAAPAVTPDFNARLYQRIEREREGGRFRRFWHAAWKPALVTVAAGLALAIGLGIRVPHSGDIPTKASVENVDIYQVEHVLEDLDLLTPTDDGSRL